MKSSIFETICIQGFKILHCNNRATYITSIVIVTRPKTIIGAIIKLLSQGKHLLSKLQQKLRNGANIPIFFKLKFRKICASRLASEIIFRLLVYTARTTLKSLSATLDVAGTHCKRPGSTERMTQYI